MRRILLPFLPCLLILTTTAAQAADPPADATAAELQRLKEAGFPLIDYHAHLKGGLTLEQLAEMSRKTGIRYGVALNCGQGFPTTDDAKIDAFIAATRGKAPFLAMQAEGREWVTMFSPAAVAKFDYVFTDAMTLTDHRGKRTRLWINEEVDIPDAEAFMERLVATTVRILNEEPIDIYVNPTFLPEVIAKDYEKLWTRPRMQQVVDAAVKNGVAIEINARYRLPSPAFLKMAKAKGAKFTFGTNNTDANLGRLEYCLEMVKECGLTPADMFQIKPDGKKPVQVKGFKRRTND